VCKLLRGELARPTDMLAAPPRRSHAGLRPLADQLALELRKRREDMEIEPAARACRVDLALSSTTWAHQLTTLSLCGRHAGADKPPTPIFINLDNVLTVERQGDLTMVVMVGGEKVYIDTMPETLIGAVAPSTLGREQETSRRIPSITPERERSRMLRWHQAIERTQALEDLAVELLARGLSVRDIEDAFKDERGRLLLSKSAVSEIGERLWADYQEFATRDLSEYDIAYLFVDGIAERIRPGQRREPVLAAWGFTAEGRKVLLHLMAGSKEDAETASAFFQDMRARGLSDPLLVTSDGQGRRRRGWGAAQSEDGIR